MKYAQSRRKYSDEQNEYLISSANNIIIEADKAKWSEIAKLFNEKFPDVQPQPKPHELRTHYLHSLDASVNRSEISNEETQFIMDFVSQHGKKWKLIAQTLNRNVNQIKNLFYRKISHPMNQKPNNCCVDFVNCLDIFWDMNGLDNFFDMNVFQLHDEEIFRLFFQST
jgi:hypothetical protein